MCANKRVDDGQFRRRLLEFSVSCSHELLVYSCLWDLVFDSPSGKEAPENRRLLQLSLSVAHSYRIRANRVCVVALLMGEVQVQSVMLWRE